MCWVDENGEIRPIPDDEQDQTYYIGEFFQYALSHDRRDLIDRWNIVKDRLNPPIYDRSELFDENIKSERIRGATLENLFAKNMVALEFGADFGETLLSVAETTAKDEFSEILTTIEKIRQEAQEFSNIFTGFDDTLNKNINRAIGERMTEVLCTIEAINKSPDNRVTAEYLGKTIEINNDSEAIAALSIVSQALSKINQEFNSSEIRTSYLNGDVAVWNLGHRGDVLLKTRTYGVQDGEFDPAVEYSGEAQINFAVSLEDQFVPAEINTEARNRALSIRIDLEGLLLDENNQKVGFDPTLDHLRATLDLGGILHGDDNNPNQIVGKAVAIGNTLRNRKLAREGRGYHTSLDEQYGDKQTFANIVAYINNLISEKDQTA